MKALAVILVAVALLGCDRAKPGSDAEVRTLVLPRIPAAMPEASGKQEFTAICTTCHSERYVIDQPELTKEGWSKVVDKMKKSYAAPVPDELTPPILDYLAAVHGKAQ